MITSAWLILLSFRRKAMLPGLTFTTIELSRLPACKNGLKLQPCLILDIKNLVLKSVNKRKRWSCRTILRQIRLEQQSTSKLKLLCPTLGGEEALSRR